MPKTITASVGIHGKNKPEDTKTVQDLLNNVPPILGGPQPKLDPDGKCGPLTCNAIQMFQLKHFGWSGADGRVDPDGQTLLILNVFTPDPGAIPQPTPVPSPEPLSTDFIFWLRFTPKFFSHPYDPKEFVLTVTDIPNNRSASYGLKFHGRAGIAPASTSGSGGHASRVTLSKPSTISGLAGQAAYNTILKKGSGKPETRLTSRLFVAQASGGFSVPFDCHLLKPTPDGTTASGASDDEASGQFIDGNFNYNLQGMFVKL